MKDRQRIRKKGIASLELMVVLVIIVLAVTTAVPVFLNENPVNRNNLTIEKLNKIKQAIIGDPEKIDVRSRLSFGFVGDTGVPPRQLELLIANADPATGNPVYPNWQEQDPGGTNPLYYGWRGPYLDNAAALVDGWGNPIVYTESDGTSPVDDNPVSIAWPLVLRSYGEDGNPATADDITLEIQETEILNYVSGRFWTRIPPRTQTNYSGTLDITYPNGLSLATQSVAIGNGKYVIELPDRKIPNGVRYFTTRDNEYFKLASLNGLGESIVDFIGTDVAIPQNTWQNPFSFNPQKSLIDGGLPIPDPEDSMGDWEWLGPGDTPLGYIFAIGGTSEHRIFFGDPSWVDYRVEVDATLWEGRGYGIYYRADGELDVTGYCFQYDPGLNSGGDSITFVVRRVFNGSEQSPFQRVSFTAAGWPYPYDVPHHISITVQGDHHIIKADGSVIMDFYDGTFSSGTVGLRSWDGQAYTYFYDMVIHTIPPMPTGEIVWWDFEEGPGDPQTGPGDIQVGPADEEVYGSYFEIGASELNGLIVDTNDAVRVGDTDNIYGQAMQFSGSGASNNGYIDFGNILNFTPTDTFTISFWVKPLTLANNGQYALIAKMRHGNRRGWSIEIEREGTHGHCVHFYLQQTRNNNRLECYNHENPGGMSAGTWYHVAVVYDGSAIAGGGTISEDDAIIYITPYSSTLVEQNPEDEHPELSLNSGSDTTHSVPMTMGHRRVDVDAFHGLIDEVRVYGRVLTYSEINALFMKYK